MDIVVFTVLKALYATLVSLDRNEGCQRSWTDPVQLAKGYGNRHNSEIIKLPSSLAFIALLSVYGHKLKYDDNEVELYCTLLKVISKHMETNQDQIFFCNNTQSAYIKMKTKKEKKEKVAAATPPPPPLRRCRSAAA